MMDLSQAKLEDFRERLNLCLNCAACFYRGPIVPHNWRELPPPEWQAPSKKCPSFEYYRFRSHTALGRLTLAALVWRKDFPISDDLIKILYTCAGCNMCNEICQTFLPLHSILALREEVVERGIALPEPLPEMNAGIKEFHNIFGRKAKAKTPEKLPAEGEDMYFAGCYANYRLPKTATATIRVLKAAGINIASLGENERCCGFLARWSGNRAQAEKSARYNVEAMKKAGAKRVILSCAHGYHMWKNDYPRYVGQLPFEVIHVTELLAKLLEEGKIAFRHEINGKITYHDPCFLGRHGKVYEQPRKVLKSIPGLELVEMERCGKWSYCCGAGAKVILNCYPDFARAVAKERLREAQQAADTLVTACPVCFEHLKKTADQEAIRLKVRDLPTLAAEAMGIEW
ncbi:MAG: hypothetical protein A2V67_06185 [Deltaproteobacteria bacterium RBG_13_61_14]|nr:MAG: hypothetical protein A2V67_06185 [Deltaproteobacteria bacterium RBG_13_61_14]